MFYSFLFVLFLHVIVNDEPFSVKLKLVLHRSASSMVHSSKKCDLKHQGVMCSHQIRSLFFFCGITFKLQRNVGRGSYQCFLIKVHIK